MVNNLNNLKKIIKRILNKIKNRKDINWLIQMEVYFLFLVLLILLGLCINDENGLVKPGFIDMVGKMVKKVVTM